VSGVGVGVIAVIVFAGLVAWGLSYLLASEYSPFSIHDAPNSRSLHEHPTPRTGGVAILIAVLLGWGILFYLGYRPGILPWIIVAAVLVAFISFLDDLITLSALPRFAVHGVAAALLIMGGLVLPWGVVGVFLTWIAIVWMLNLYNFMDGMDGFSAGMTLFGFGFLGLAGWLEGAQTYAFYSWVIVLGAAGFLALNFPPARIFMGDIGSIPLGLLAAAFSLWGIRDGLFPLWLPVLIFSPFVVDATVTILRRLLGGEKIWQAHRSHYYQRLVLAGWSHRRTALFEYLLMFCCGVTAMLARQTTEINLWILLGVWGGVYIAIMAWVGQLEEASQ
jgi:UDP-N-acetylmuramyl pentapeptide phosphotransferase/UDP-N-acetylglucosamine-1-phosphate transferase